MSVSSSFSCCFFFVVFWCELDEIDKDYVFNFFFFWFFNYYYFGCCWWLLYVAVALVVGLFSIRNIFVCLYIYICFCMSISAFRLNGLCGAGMMLFLLFVLLLLVVVVGTLNDYDNDDFRVV